MAPGFYFALIYFFYGLAFFSMGVVITQEVGRCSDARLRHALRYLAAFGLIHGIHEWLEMFQGIGVIVGQPEVAFAWEIVRIFLLVVSFLALIAFGIMLLAHTPDKRRLNLLLPLGFAALWSFGLLLMSGFFPPQQLLWDVVDVWTRYSLAIPAAFVACTGLIVQQREFRRAGMAQFGQDSLWAAVAFGWYGLIGQVFTRPSALPPSHLINSVLFMDVFGFPVQLLRASAAVVVAIFVIRFLRSFEVETERKIAQLQAARLKEAQRREAVHRELLRRVVGAQESERQRVARELHDETGQSLTAIGLGLRGVTHILRQDADKAENNLRMLEGLVARSLDELQRLISDLRPSHLDDLGLPAALRWYTNEIQNRLPLKINMEITGEPRELPTELKTAIFRIAQEALTNVIKHSGASNVNVRLCYQTDVVSLSVQDDGRGFDIRSGPHPQRPTWGLLGMQERTTLLGGKLILRSEINQGTEVMISIPYYKTEEVDDDNPAGISG
jgi:signal transduction histidine kinase